MNDKKRLLLIGSRRYKKRTIKSLIEEGEKLFDSVLFVPIHKIRIVEEKGENRLYYKDIDLLKFDVCYPRMGAKDFFLAQAVLKIIDDSNMYSPVTLESYQYSNHKYYTVKKLIEAGLPTLPSSLSISSEASNKTINKFGFPVVLKLISGFAGKGVMLVKDKKQLASILDTVHLFEEYVSAQVYAKSGNSDIRCYVFGDEVITAQRTGAKGDWRANMSRGGKVKLIKTTPQLKKIAVKAARTLKFDICAVDFIKTKKVKGGFAIIEINFQPGPFYEFLGNTVTKAMIEFLYKKASKRSTQ